jgi:hypothetical protein
MPNFHASGAHAEPPRERRREHQTQHEQAEHADLHPGQISHGEKNRHQRDRGAEIGLLVDQHERNQREDAADREVAPGRSAAVFAEELGQHERDGDLGELGRLQVEARERNPPPGAHHGGAEEQHVDQQRQDGEVDQVRLVGERAIVQAQRHHHHGQAEDDGVDLRNVHVRHRPRRIGRRAVDHHDAEAAQRDDGEEQCPVDVVVQPSFKHG